MAEQFITDIKKLPKRSQDTLAANAKSRGMTAQEYLESRGGIDPVTKKYGDSYDPNVDLTPAEYLAAVAGKEGVEAGKAINAATEAKVAQYNAANTTLAPVETPEGPTGPTLTSTTDNANLVVNTGTSTATLSTPAPAPALTYKASDGTVFTDQAAYVAYQKMITDKATSDAAVSAENATKRQSAYDLLYAEFSKYGLGSLVQPLESLIKSGASPDEFSLKLRESEAYKKRFSANAQRIAKGLKAISEAEYIGLEDQYQNIMRNYGLPAEYYTRGDMGIQEGFNKFIANDVSAAELEDRVLTAQQRVLNANPEVLASLKQFYPGITNGDILAYTLDPTKALTDIKRKVTAAEIGGAATQAGLGLTGTRAEELGAAGITKQQAQQGFQTVAEVAPRGGQLAAMYGESPYTQQTAEQEVFGLAGSTEAAKQRKKLAGLERATFSGQTGAAQGALGRERAGNF